MEQNGLVNDPHNAPSHVPHDSALSVGSSKAEDAAKIKDLEDEVRVLAERANVASQKFADYENEIRVLEAKLRQEQRKNSTPALVKLDSVDGSSITSASQSTDRPGISRFGSFIGSRNKPSATLQQNGTLQAPGGRERDLEEKLVKEQTTRIAAEKKVKEVNAEIEDLSATLFQQANEMVATERKENATLRDQLLKLEQQKFGAEQTLRSLKEQQHDGVIEDDSVKLRKENDKLKEKIKALEHREQDRKRRLDRLEAANRRIERVKAMLQPP